MLFVERHVDDKFYIEGNQRIDVRKKIARELCVNLLTHREFSNPYPAKLIIEKENIRTENANKAKMIGTIDVNCYEPYPKNPKIARVFKEIGLADELGSGIINMVKYTKIYAGTKPELKEDGIFRAIIPLEQHNTLRENSQFIYRTFNQQFDMTNNNDQDVSKKSDQDKIIYFCIEPKTLTEIMQMMHLSHKTNFRNNYIIPLIQKGLLQRTIPDKPNSKYQKYVSKK